MDTKDKLRRKVKAAFEADLTIKDLEHQLEAAKQRLMHCTEEVVRTIEAVCPGKRVVYGGRAYYIDANGELATEAWDTFVLDGEGA